MCGQLPDVALADRLRSEPIWDRGELHVDAVSGASMTTVSVDHGPSEARAAATRSIASARCERRLATGRTRSSSDVMSLVSASVH
jgi:hypothetical protein